MVKTTNQTRCHTTFGCGAPGDAEWCWAICQASDATDVARPRMFKHPFVHVCWHVSTWMPITYHHPNQKDVRNWHTVGWCIMCIYIYYIYIIIQHLIIILGSTDGWDCWENSAARCRGRWGDPRRSFTFAGPKGPRESDDLWILDLNSQMLMDVDGCWWTLMDVGIVMLYDVIIYKYI